MEKKLCGKDITVIIPAYNEETRIERCIKSCFTIAKRIIVMDNLSTDSTCDIAKSLGAEVYSTEQTYKERLTWAIEKDDIDTTWIFYIDADEELTSASANEILKLCTKYKEDENVNGIVCRYRKVFMGKELIHSGSGEWKMRLFKRGTAEFEVNVELDEHVILKKGKSVAMKNCILHHSFRDINHLITKLNGFAKRKAEELVRIETGEAIVDYTGLARITKIRRFIKFNVYYKLPPGFRAWLYYVRCCYFKFGFLDGKIGKTYLFFRIYWYGMLTDTYYMEMKNKQEEMK